MRPVFIPLSDATAAHYRRGGLDANGLPPERRISDGSTIPCRHSLRLVPRGEPYLIVAHRPFDGLNPYTETGPIFVSATEGAGSEHGPVPGPELPAFLTSPQYIVRGSSADERIIYGTGAVVATGAIIEACAGLLARADVAFVHIRSASNNCFHVRAERG
ncbi:DUF1203 domain-containing protein [Pararhodobacter sp.]|uniref:DUF1203 domain-containing protein n=1 Tax=Pararhodobacter sp. TaxID=2127056 RepID=UPI002FDF07CB